MSVTIESVRARLEQVGQGHVLRFAAELSEDGRLALLDQIAGMDLEGLPTLIEAYVKRTPGFVLPPGVEPAPYFPAGGDGSGGWDRAAAARAGETLIRAGKVAAFVVAGGQGSRLGFEGPKGCYPAGPVTDAPLFQIFAEHILGVKDRLGVRVPWYVMTSPLNHEATAAFFEAHAYFGLAREDVMFFRQGVMPSLELRTGRLMLADKGELATNPDGHGGAVKALHRSGALRDMRSRGVEHLSYFQVDNPLVRVIDPVFLGIHAGYGADSAGRVSSGEMSSKMVTKASPEEKVGVFCGIPDQHSGPAGTEGLGPTPGKRVEVIEYSDLPMELQRQRLADGTLRFNAGSIAIHAMSVDFLERLATDPAFALPFHRAEKKIPCVDPETGAPVKPAANNGVKLERFVFDALAMCRSSVVMETIRSEEFGPIKNAEGVDSPATSRALQSERAARWLEHAGVAVPRRPDGTPDCVLEISGRTASCVEDLAGARLPRAVERGARLAL